MDSQEFTRALKELKADYRSAGENPQGFELKDCTHCGSCMFCSGCENCYRCTHCQDCVNCSNSTHCMECEGCHSSAYCVESSKCVSCKYLEYCESCADCTYCFGCVGLSRADFHILNEKYPRTEYFELVEQLRRALGQKRRRL